MDLEVEENFLAEIALMSHIHHPSILNLVGVCKTAKPGQKASLAMISEYCAGGNLFLCLGHLRDFAAKGKFLSLQQQHSILEQVS